jgi:hypothetical protein
MNREWVTLAFGILLVTVVAVVSVWQNYPGRTPDTAATPPAATEPAAAPAAPTIEEKPGAPEPAPKPAAPKTPPRSSTPAQAPAPARLDASVPVVHKHRFGDCEGTLRAAAGTLTYATTHAEDGFRIAFSEIDAFDLDAAENNLRVRRRGGRTWNFTTRGDTAPALAAFHREASRAR